MNQYASLNLKPGDVVYLDKYRGTPRDQMCKVLSIRDVQKLPVQLRTLMDNRITRSHRLIVLEDMYDGLPFSVYDAFAWGHNANWWKRLCYWIGTKLS